MKSEKELRDSIRQWIVKKSGKIRSEELKDDTPIIEQRIISSLQIMDLILLIEHLSGRAIDVNSLKPGVFKNIDTIVANFMKERR